METRTYYLTKYAMVDAIKIAPGRPSESNPAYITNDEGANWFFLKLGRDIFENEDDARARAEQMRKRRIASLKKQIAKLEAMNFGSAK